MAIDLDFRLRQSPTELQDRNLAEVSEIALHYELFQGDIRMVINGEDFSTDWGWVPGVDFALCLVSVLKDLGDGERQILEFTESDALIEFERHDGVVHVSANYCGAHVDVSYTELFDAARAFAQGFIDRLVVEYPALRKNRALEREMRVSSLSSS